MARIRKAPNRYWSKEDKYKIVLKVIDDGRSTVDVAKEYDISQSMLSKWVRKYIKYGADSLENKKKPGNPAALTITLLAGGASPVSAHLVIIKIA